MNTYSILAKKRDGGTLTPDEIRFFIQGYTKGEIADYQASALLMAICINGMNADETSELTLAMLQSGDQADLSSLAGIPCDKHSTGGVGDKTSLITVPIVAACGGYVAKMSGRGLGFTGGTIDKLESIPGFRTALTVEEMVEYTNRSGLCICGQTGSLAPADKKLYALRDVTATVDSIPLIAASIMSKKLASGAQAIVLDVKTGSGAFMKEEADSVALAEAMVGIGKSAGRRIAALITDMDQPLGRCVGNGLEVREAAELLQGKSADNRLYRLSVELAARMLALSGLGTVEDCRVRAEKAVSSGKAFEKLCRMAQQQGGDPRALEQPERLPQGKFSRIIKAPRSGYLSRIDTARIGHAAGLLGAGRVKKEDSIDLGAGIIFAHRKGEKLQAGEELCRICAGSEAGFSAAEEAILGGMEISDRPPVCKELIRQVIE
ncbi:MAG: thymidine phosphorylase [Ruminococcaceae bacterium]|nr:thymidine phosphorylase [Oscillospiraceae bacterium]